MASSAISTKRLLINKANTSIVVYVSVAAFIAVFSLVAIKTLVGQAAYQNRIINAKRGAVNQLKTDISTTTQLKDAYNAFTGTSQNVIGGNSGGAGSQDGDNAKIVLDALPSSYDFPGLTTSLENLLTNQNGITINSIAGTDNEATQGANQLSANPQPSPIPFTVSVTGNYAAIQNVISTFERSIRPIQIQTMSLNGDSNNLTMTVTAQTFYQPAKSFNINKKVIQ